MKAEPIDSAKVEQVEDLARRAGAAMKAEPIDSAKPDALVTCPTSVPVAAMKAEPIDSAKSKWALPDAAAANCRNEGGADRLRKDVSVQFRQEQCRDAAMKAEPIDSAKANGEKHRVDRIALPQ